MNEYDVGASFLGLGFSHNGGNEASSQAPSSSPIDAADSLMKHYLQQCLDFHDEQLQHSQQQVEESPIPEFVTAQHPPPFVPTTQSQPPQASVTMTTTEQSAVTSSVTNPLSNPSAQEAIAKAQAIVQKFQQQHHHHFPLQESHTSLQPCDYRYRRQRQLEKEQERLHKATMKNFEYVAKQEEERLKRQLAQLQETQVLEQRLQEQQAAMLASRREQQATLSKAGIGTSRRQALEKQKQRKGHAIKLNDELSVAAYLSGLPTNVTQDFVQSLFESYGKIRRVHLYRNKQTGELKGDALVVYNVRRLTEKQEILDAVCSQVS